MTKAQICRLIDLTVAKALEEKNGPIHVYDKREYQRLWKEFEQWDVAPPDESEELKLAYDQLFQESKWYQEGLARNTQSWRNICRYWKQKAESLAAELKAMRTTEEEENRDGQEEVGSPPASTAAEVPDAQMASRALSGDRVCT